MKVELLKDEYGHFEIVVKKHEKIISISIVAKDEFVLDTDYSIPDSIQCNNSLRYGRLVLDITQSKNRIKIVKFGNKEGSNMIEYSHRISTFDDKINFGLRLCVYHISHVKGKK
jgi:hypothetical protein